MVRLYRVVCSLILLVFVGLMAEQKASAYADPGSGALLWQAIASGFVLAGFYLRKLIAMGKNRRKREE